MAAYDGLACALKHLNPEHNKDALGGLAVDKILVLLTNGLERPERSVRLAAGYVIQIWLSTKAEL